MKKGEGEREILYQHVYNAACHGHVVLFRFYYCHVLSHSFFFFLLPFFFLPFIVSMNEIVCVHIHSKNRLFRIQILLKKNDFSKSIQISFIVVVLKRKEKCWQFCHTIIFGEIKLFFCFFFFRSSFCRQFNKKKFLATIWWEIHKNG